MYGASRSGLNARIFVLDYLSYLRGSPIWLLVLQMNNESFNLVRRLIRMLVRRSAAVIKPRVSVLLITIPDLVAGDPGNSKLPAQRRHFLARQQTADELSSLVHDTRLFPRHMSPPSCEIDMPKSVNDAPE